MSRGSSSYWYAIILRISCSTVGFSSPILYKQKDIRDGPDIRFAGYPDWEAGYRMLVADHLTHQVQHGRLLLGDSNQVIIRNGPDNRRANIQPSTGYPAEVLWASSCRFSSN